MKQVLDPFTVIPNLQILDFYGLPLQIGDWVAFDTGATRSRGAKKAATTKILSVNFPQKITDISKISMSEDHYLYDNKILYLYYTLYFPYPYSIKSISCPLDPNDEKDGLTGTKLSKMNNLASSIQANQTSTTLFTSINLQIASLLERQYGIRH